MTLRTQTFVRAFVSIVVIVLTFILTYRNTTISENWSSIFLLVIGYYFSDRPSTVQAQAAGTVPHLSDARLELLAQLVGAILLVAGTAALFVLPQPRTEIEGAWIAGVALAVGFYFKDSGGIVTVHVKAQAVLAVLMLALTASVYGSTGQLPLQWLSLVFLVVAFYFKTPSANPSPDTSTPTGTSTTISSSTTTSTTTSTPPPTAT